MNYEDAWAREARAEILKTPVLDDEELGLFRWHVGMTESLIAKLTKSATKTTARQLALRDDCAGDGWIPVDYFVKRIRYGQIIYLVSLVETFLTKAYERLEVVVGKQTSPIRLDKFSRQNLDKRREFLERYGNFSFPAEHWQEIEKMIRIRNILVHQNGAVKQKDDKLLQEVPGAHVIDRELVLDASYISACSSTIGNFFRCIEAELYNAG